MNLNHMNHMFQSLWIHICHFPVQDSLRPARMARKSQNFRMKTSASSFCTLPASAAPSWHCQGNKTLAVLERREDYQTCKLLAHDANDIPSIYLVPRIWAIHVWSWDLIKLFLKRRPLLEAWVRIKLSELHHRNWRQKLTSSSSCQ